jgi:rRNA processing
LSLSIELGVDHDVLCFPPGPMGPSKDGNSEGHRAMKRPPNKSHGERKQNIKRRDAAQVVLSVEAFAHQKGAGAAKAIEGFRKRKEAKRVNTAKELRSYQRLMKRQGYEPGTGASRRRRGREEAGGDDAGANSDNDKTDVLNPPQRPSDSGTSTVQGAGWGDRDRKGPARSNDKSVASRGDDDDEFLQPVDDEDRESPTHLDDSSDRKHRRATDGSASRGAASAAVSNSKDRRPHKASTHKPQHPHKSSLQRAADRRLERIQQEQERRKQQEKIRAQKLRERRQRTKMLGERTKKGQPIMKNIVHDILRKLEREQEQQQQQPKGK